MVNLIREDFENAQSERPWELVNNILYGMCEEYFDHGTPDKIISKVSLIGRAYSASIERRRNNIEDDKHVDFWEGKVVPAFTESKIDEMLEELKDIKSLSYDKLQEVIYLHNYLTEILSPITMMKNTSFCSKYLHFHLPNIFFIYDSNAVKGLSKIKIADLSKYDEIINRAENKSYASFFCKCFELREQIDNQYSINLTPRQLDNILFNYRRESKK